MEVIKRIVSRKNFRIYNIPESFGEKAEVIILPYQEGKNQTEHNESLYLMKAQEQNGSVSMLNEPEEDAWNDL
ncbi:MAG: hypothetical protein ACOYOV_12765 [Bacteroidales bacterium]